jgi:4-hydroxy-tetrahydrodipicolinate synthase
MTHSVKFTGTGVALITPFCSDKSIDFQALEKLVEHVIQNQIDFLVVQGTTAEAATLSTVEKKAVLDCIITANKGQKPLVLGLGGNNTAHQLEQIRNSDFSGVDALLIATPYYNKPNQRGLYEHYKALAEASPLPIILYNVPSRTGSNLEASTTLQLAREFRNIIAIKEASGKLDQVMDILKYKPKDFLVLSGDDASTLPLLSLGAQGVISVIANAFPYKFGEITRNMFAGKLKEAQQIHYQLTDLLKLIFEEGNPAGIKAVLAHQEKIENQLRLPLVTVSSSLYKKISHETDQI